MNPSAFASVERRASGRHAVVPNLVRLEWWERGESRSSPGRLIDISREGALLQADEPPPVGQVVWCHLEEPTRTDWVKMRVVRSGVDRLAGVLFPDPCPDDFYLAATAEAVPEEVEGEPCERAPE
jgi:hypothetical protein